MGLREEHIEHGLKLHEVLQKELAEFGASIDEGGLALMISRT